MANDVAGEVVQAVARITPYVRETYLERSPHFSREYGARVFFKLENLQHTGSFKVRGAFNKLLSLSAEARRRGVVAASTGNHGISVAYCAMTLGVKGRIFVPENADPKKVEVIEKWGMPVQRYGNDIVDTEAYARAYAAQNDMVYVSPYNDLKVVGGQGTIGFELQHQAGQIAAVFVAVGGGGLMAGIAGYLKSIDPTIRMIGCSPENSAVMARSVAAGRILDIPSEPTLSDGTAGGIEPGSITFSLCCELVDEFVTVTEDEIRASIGSFIRNHHMLIEGAAAVPLAAYRKVAERFEGQKVVIVLCGANISHGDFIVF